MSKPKPQMTGEIKIYFSVFCPLSDKMLVETLNNFRDFVPNGTF